MNVLLVCIAGCQNDSGMEILFIIFAIPIYAYKLSAKVRSVDFPSYLLFVFQLIIQAFNEKHHAIMPWIFT